MEFQRNHHISASPSSSTASDPNPNHHPTTTTTTAATSDPIQSWWESISKARTQIHSLSTILPTTSPPNLLPSLADSDRPARSLLSSPAAYSALSSALSLPSSASGDNPLCHWLYDTYQSSDPDLRLLVLSFIPLLSGLYLSRIAASSDPQFPSLAGFEAVLLAIYAAETKSRAGKPLLISIPDLAMPSLYHTPVQTLGNSRPRPAPAAGVLSPPLEPQIAVKSTKRACIVGVALDCFYKQISNMPSWSKLDLCEFAAVWAGQNCPCRSEFDEDVDVKIDSFSDVEEENEIGDVAEEMSRLGIREKCVANGARIPLPWEILQPVFRILGHCLLGPLNSQDVKDSASVAVRALYARASHDLVPQAILASRSLIQLDKRARAAAKAVAVANASSNANTPSKVKKPEILLVSK